MNKLTTKAQHDQLLINGSNENLEEDFVPVAQLTLPGTACCWLLTELDLKDHDVAFGLYDNGYEPPQMGYIYLDELEQVVVPPYKSAVFNNPLFTGVYPVSVYLAAAKAHGRIVWDPALLKRFAALGKEIPQA